MLTVEHCISIKSTTLLLTLICINTRKINLATNAANFAKFTGPWNALDNESLADEINSIADNEAFLPEYIDDDDEWVDDDVEDKTETGSQLSSEEEKAVVDELDNTQSTPSAISPVPSDDMQNAQAAPLTTPASSNARPSEEEPRGQYDHLQQLFITKNPNLCKEVEHIFTNLTHAYPREAQARIRVENSPMPTRFQNAHPDSFPYFLTLKEFLIILGKKLENIHKQFTIFGIHFRVH